MVQDRLTALRAQRGPNIELNRLENNDQAVNRNGTNEGGLAAFYTEVSSINDQIQRFDSNVSHISDLHLRSLNATDEAALQQNHAELDEVVAETRSLSSTIRERIRQLGQFPVAPRDAQQRATRTKALQQKFIESLQNYQQAEAQYRDRYKQRVERQFKIVKPNATPEEVSAVVNDTEGGGSQIFAQAVSSSNRYGESRAAYREVQERHEDIRKIEQTFIELTQLINDMNVLLAQQDDSINKAEMTTAGVMDDTGAGLKHTDVAVKHARAARRKRWICFGLFILIIVILALILGIYFGIHH